MTLYDRGRILRMKLHDDEMSTNVRCCEMMDVVIKLEKSIQSGKKVLYRLCTSVVPSITPGCSMHVISV